MSAASLGLLGPLLAGGSLPTLDSTYGAVLLGTFFGLMCVPSHPALCI